MTYRSVAVYTMGCRANQYDSNVIEGMLAKEGWKLVDFTSPAEAYVINSCTVTNKADSEARQLIRRAKRLNPEASVIITGCYAQTQPEELSKIEGVSFVLGNNQKSALLHYLQQAKPLAPEIVVEDLFKEEVVFTSDFACDAPEQNARAYLKIQDGCNQMCSYCVIPFARGKNRSSPLETVLTQLRKLSAAGFDEVVLTGIHIGTYGYDLNPKTSLIELMRQIEIEKPVHRVRLSSIDPEEVGEDMIEFLAHSKVFCEYLHIPLQSGNDEILKLMRRRYTAREFQELAQRLKQAIPQICLGTDVMVGFPYEDDGRFESTYQLLQDSPLDYLHVFPFSAKRKTRAASFLGQVSAAVKKQRVQRLTELSRNKKEKFYRSASGKNVEVILEEVQEEAGNLVFKGTSRNFLSIQIPGAATESRIDFEKKRRKAVEVNVHDYRGGILVGQII